MRESSRRRLQLCIHIAIPLFLALSASFAVAQKGEIVNPSDCGTQAVDWKPCIERQIADQVFGSCCERFVPPECRGMCTYETSAVEARVVLMHTIQPSRCRLYKYLSAIVHCAAQTHDNTACCMDQGMQDVGEHCLDLCKSQSNPRQPWGVKSLRRDLITCLSKWDQIMKCHQGGLRARKVPGHFSAPIGSSIAAAATT